MVKSAVEIRLLILRAMRNPLRKDRAKGLIHAFVLNAALSCEVKQSLPKELQRLYDEQVEQYETNKLPPEHFEFVTEKFPMIAELLNLGADILNIIEEKSYWRELGFATFEAFDAAIEDEAYLSARFEEIKRSQNYRYN